MSDPKKAKPSNRPDTPITIWHNDSARAFDPHWHMALEIIMPVENWYDASIGEDFFHIVPGDILFIPPKGLHSLKAPDQGKRLIFLFDLTPLHNLRDFSDIRAILAKPLLLNRQNHPGIYDEVCHLLTQMDLAYSAGQEYADLTIFSHLLTLLVLLGENQTKQAQGAPCKRVYKQKEYLDKFNTLMEYLDTHYMEELDMETVAESVGFSKYHFARLFKQFTHVTFGAYLSRRRIRAAEDLLLQPELSITEVALQSGFPSISTFNRVFRQHKNCTPSEFREKNSHYRRYR